MPAIPHIEAQDEVRRLLAELVSKCANPSKAEEISDKIETLVASYLVPSEEVSPLGIAKTTKMQRRVLDRLAASFGKIVSKDALMSALYFDKSDEPQSKIVDIYVYHLRDRLEHTDFRIATDYGRGYRLVHKEEFEREYVVEGGRMAMVASSDRMYPLSRVQANRMRRKKWRG